MVNQQHPFSLFGFTLGVRTVLFPELLLLVFPPAPVGLLCTLDFISLERVVNAFYTLTASFADVSRNFIPRESARVFPSSAFTCRLAYKSDLFPTSNLTTFQLPYLSTSASQFSMSLNDCLSVISQTRMIPCAPLQYEAVMVLNLYCPAVSQICNLTVLPLDSNVLILKSTPMVGRKLLLLSVLPLAEDII